MKDKDTQLIFEAYSESKDNVEDVVQQIRTTRYGQVIFTDYLEQLFHGQYNADDVRKFVADKGNNMSDEQDDDLARRLTIALNYVNGDESRLNHLIDELKAAEERFQKGEDFDDEPLPGADDGPDYVGLDPFAKADELEQSKPYY
jgi:hypothetical protein